MYSDMGDCSEPVRGEMKVEAVIVCVNYADFLAQTLPNNKKYLDRIIVVTDLQDDLTVAVCRDNGVDCIQTNEFYDENAVFNKGRGINVGLMALAKDAWVIHMDADIWLSPHTRIVLDARHFEKDCIYGMDRLMCHGWDAWTNFLERPRAINELYYLVQPYAFPIGSRVAHYNQKDGWFPIGFFQMWNPYGSGVFHYPTNSPGADHTDVLFAKLFPIGKRHLIAETYCIHVDSERAEMGKNWNGRKTKWFGPSPLKVEEPKAEEKEPCPPPIVVVKEAKQPRKLVKHEGCLIKILRFILYLLK